MLSDREYMRDPFEEQPSRVNLSGNKILMILLVGLFFIQMMLERFAHLDVTGVMGLVPSMVVDRFFIWQPFTYMFFHPAGDRLLVIIFNMIGLFFFGPIVESLWGRKKYLQFFVAAGVFAALVVTPIAYMGGVSQYPILGASSSVLGILVVAALSNPNMKVLLFFAIPIRIKYMICLFLGIDLYILVQSSTTKVIDGAIPHLAGAAFGLLYYQYENEIERFFKGLEQPSSSSSSSSSSSTTTENRSDPEEQERALREKTVNRLLDKINQDGISSLTERERNILEQASEEMKQEEIHGQFKKDSH